MTYLNDLEMPFTGLEISEGELVEFKQKHKFFCVHMILYYLQITPTTYREITIILA